MTELSFKASDYVLLAARMRVEARYSGPCAANDLRLADEWEAQARTKQLPSTRTEIGAGGELIDRENRCDPTFSRSISSPPAPISVRVDGSYFVRACASISSANLRSSAAPL